MGSGVNRRFWSDQGSRTSRRLGTKAAMRANAKPTALFQRRKIKALRAEAKRRASEGS